MPNIITARGLQKSYGKSVALKSLDFMVESGRIFRSDRPEWFWQNDAVKSHPWYDPHLGELSVLGFMIRPQRDALMEEVFCRRRSGVAALVERKSSSRFCRKNTSAI